MRSEEAKGSPRLPKVSPLTYLLPSGDVRCRLAGTQWQCNHKATSGGIYCDKHGLTMENRNKKQRKGDPRPSRTSNTLLTLSKGSVTRKKGRKCRKEASSSGGVKCGREVTKRQGGGRKRLRDEEMVSDDLVSGLGEIVRKKRGGVSVNDELEEKAASPDNETTSEQNAVDNEENDDVTLPFLPDYNSHEELHENGGMSFVTDGAMNAVDFSCEQVEVENDVMEVQSTVYVGDFSIPAEYVQIYKEIKDLHGPLENGESVCAERRLSRETLVELLKVAHELGSLTMESMTETTTISDLERTVAIGKLFNYNVGWLDESLERLSDVHAKCCAVDGELKQVEWKITEKKHEEDILKLEVDEIDENIQLLEESMNQLKQKQEMIEMEKKKKYSNVSSLQERILETSERICDTSTEFYRIAAQPW